MYVKASIDFQKEEKSPFIVKIGCLEAKDVGGCRVI